MSLCFGADADHMTHVPGCRPARPLCRVMRRVQPQRRVCNCAAYHFPHRTGSSRCGRPEAVEMFVHGPERATGPYPAPASFAETFSEWVAERIAS